MNTEDTIAILSGGGQEIERDSPSQDILVLRDDGRHLKLAFRVLIEIFFLYLYGRLYKFDLAMPEKFWCDQRPCNNKVACYIGKKKECNCNCEEFLGLRSSMTV